MLCCSSLYLCLGAKSDASAILLTALGSSLADVSDSKVALIYLLTSDHHHATMGFTALTIHHHFV